MFLICSLIFLFMHFPRSVFFNSSGHDTTLAIDGSMKADREKAFLLSRMFFVMISASAVGVIKNWEKPLGGGWGWGEKMMKINCGCERDFTLC